MNGNGSLTAEYAASLAQEALNVAGPPVISEAASAPGEAPLQEQAYEPAPLGTWQLRTLADAYEPRTALEYVLAGIIALETLTIVFGAPGSLKSMLLADLVVCVAGGLPWLPVMGVAGSGNVTRRVPVLWVDLDNGRRRTDERFDALGRAREVPTDVPLSYVSMPTPWLDASNASLMQRLEALILSLEVKFVVIDNLGLISGSVKENEDGMTLVMSNLRRLCEETGAAVVVVHHQRKSTGTAARKGEALRGHSSIEAALDLALHVDRQENTDEVLVTSTKNRGAPVAPFGALFAYDHAPDSSDLAKARFYRQPDIALTGEQAIDQAVTDCLDVGSELNKTKLTDAVKALLPTVGINAIRARIDHLAQLGKLLERTGNGTERLYRLP